jgi:uncharacterized protein (DUF697 family)
LASKLPVVHRAQAAAGIAEAILRFVRRIPASSEKKSRTPAQAARNRASAAAAKAALAAGTLALPPGPFGWITILPEMAAVWRIQSQMVADIAAIYGRKSTLTEEQMVYCLFRHSVPQAVRDLIAHTGGRVLVHRASLAFMQSVARKIGVTLSRKVLGRGLSRWVPVAGALGVGAYAYYDTAQVAKTAIGLFEREIEIQPQSAD